MRLQQLVVALVFALLPASPVFGQSVNVTDDISASTTWTADNEYFLDGLIFVNEGATLTIEPGTVVKGLLASNITTGDDASALIVRRGAKIEAVGTPTLPIIFTSEEDDVNDSDDLDQRDRGLWGGVILLGNATNNEPNADTQIEGIPVEDEDASYGGTDDTDDSGTLRYVSIRHGGFSISGVEGDEINGLTLGSIGSGTTIEFVEVYANFDDCFEFFGGTVNTRYLVGAFCGDDGMDYDQGFRGKGQFWFVIQDDDTAGRAGEHDGGDSGGDTAVPFSTPVISNATYIGSGNGAVVPGGDNNDRAFAIRDNAAGMYFNSIFTDFAGVALNIEDIDGDDGDSRGRLEAGDLAFVNNIWFGFGAGTTMDAIIDGDFAEANLADDDNVVVDPQIASIGRTNSGSLDPRPVAGSVALSGYVTPGDAFFTEVEFRGAFGKDNWLHGWTALDNLGYVGEISNVAIDPINETTPSNYSLQQNYPNPFNPTTTIEFAVDATQYVSLSVYDILGRRVATLVANTVPAGVYKVTFNASDLTSGLYLYRLELDGAVIDKTMALIK